MRIQRNAKRESWLLEQIRTSFTRGGPRDGVHLSDLLNVRRSFWQRVLPLPPTNADILYWLAGRGHEDALGRVAGLVVTPQEYIGCCPQCGARVAGEAHDGGRVPLLVCPVCGAEVDDLISYRPDFMFAAGTVPGEFKTRRYNLAAEGEEAIEYESYLEQLRGYCAIKEANYGLLLVLSLLEGKNRNDPMSKSEPALAAYDVFFSDEELEATRALLEERRAAFTAALVGWSMEQLGVGLGDFWNEYDASDSAQAVAQACAKPLPLCKDWLCGKPRRVVDNPAYCRHPRCEKEINHKPEHEHVAAGYWQAPVERWEYEPRCKYHQACRPQDVDPARGARR